VNRKISQLLQQRVQLYFICLALFALVSAAFNLWVAAAEGLVVVLLGLRYQRTSRRRKKEIVKYIENITGTVDVASKDTMTNSPLPMVIFRLESDDVIWTNERFLQLSRGREHLFDAKLSALVPGFDPHWLMEGKTQCPTEVEYNGGRFLVFGHLVRTGDKSGGFLATTYWVDVTEFARLRDQYHASRPVAAVLMLDNYEDLMKNLTETARSALLSEIDERIDAWVSSTGGILHKYERDRYLFLFEEQYLQQFIDKKFDILDAVHSLTNASGIAATLSIGVGVGGETFQELMQYANLSIEMALSRGGDQAVIRNQLSFDFYGGRSKETEKRTKVKSRVMANALSALVTDASRIFVMGHKAADNDAVGAAAGVCAIARKKGVRANIIQETVSYPGKTLADRLMKNREYEECFLSPQEASWRWTPGPSWWWWTPTARSRRSPWSCCRRPTGWRSSTTTAVRPPISRARPSTTTSPTPPPPASWSPSFYSISWSRRTCCGWRRRPCWRASCWTPRTSLCAPAGGPLTRRPSCAGPGRTPPR